MWGWKIQWVAAVLQELWSSYAPLMIIYTTRWTNSFGIMYFTTCQWPIQEKSLDQSSMWAWIWPQTLSGTEQRNCTVQWFLLDLLPCKLTPVIPFSLEGEVLSVNIKVHVCMSTNLYEYVCSLVIYLFC